jgi:signal transduction histidine kinase
MIINFSEDSADVQSLLDIAIRSTQRIQRLTSSLLDINRLEAGQPILEKSLTPPQDMLYDSVDALRPVLETKRINTILAIPDDIPSLMINEGMIQRVIINLIENAIKFTPSRGTIKLGAQKRNKLVHIWVHDTGFGIPEENLQSIFEKYTKLHHKTGHRGYGLGLAYCRLAVEGHGGTIWAENLPEGGSGFTFTIPIPEELETLVREI